MLDKNKIKQLIILDNRNTGNLCKKSFWQYKEFLKICLHLFVYILYSLLLIHFSETTVIEKFHYYKYIKVRNDNNF